ncbi:peptidylprolyl isomerase SurA [Rheinheimera sp.]|jgi:peptidyl-prolyl cis-trans isomerase SurA|uniref:peptidylprolyl isomerase SurA n=1 Tax=Rheinheimera sp. TaxID=1869214 RepID=UPI003D2D355B
MKLTQLIAATLTTCVMLNCQAVETKVDAVAAIVNNSVVLETEVRDMVARVKKNAAKQGQTLPSDSALQVQALERLIMNSLQLQVAKRMGLQITDAQLDQTIENIAREQKVSVEQFRAQVVREEGSYELFRERLREEITTGEVLRANVQRRIYVSPQEIDTLTKMMEQQGASNEQYNIGHILLALPGQPTAEQIKDAESKATKVMELLRGGSDFKKIAIASSSAETALEGGDMGWMNINEMPTLFADQVRGKKKKDLIGPLRSGAGFHILTIFDIKGANVVEFEEISSRHVLIKPSIIVSEEKAKNMLAKFAVDFKAGKADFAKFAKEHSEDPGSRLKGGELGWADPNVFVPEFRDTLKTLKKDQLSEPFRTEHGWHIVQLMDRRTVDATAEKKREQVTRMIYNRRFNEESSNFLREIRDEAFIEVLADK